MQLGPNASPRPKGRSSRKRANALIARRLATCIANALPNRKARARARLGPPPMYQKPHARAAEASGSVKEVASDAESKGSQTAPPAYTMKDLKAAIKSMTTEDKEKFLDDMALDSDQDF